MIVFIRSRSPSLLGARVERVAKSLSEHGFEVTLMGWDREGTFDGSKPHGNRKVYGLALRAPYNKMVLLAYYPVFWLWALLKMLKINPSIVHAYDLDVVLPALLYRSVRRGTKVVFEVCDSYSMLIRSRSPLLSSFVLNLERYAASASDAVIVASRWLLHPFRGVKIDRMEIIVSYPDPMEELASNSHWHKSIGAFRIVYAGIIDPDRGLIQIAEASKGIDGVEFLVAGRVMDNKTFEAIRFAHVKYVGQLDYGTALDLEGSADAIPVLYNWSSPYHRLVGASPNKLFEAMMLGVPIITNFSHILKETRCGILVQYGNVGEIRDAILFLKEHSDAKQKFGENGRLAFRQKYNWSLMEGRLLSLYRDLLIND